MEQEPFHRLGIRAPSVYLRKEMHPQMITNRMIIISPYRYQFPSMNQLPPPHNDRVVVEEKFKLDGPLNYLLDLVLVFDRSSRGIMRAFLFLLLSLSWVTNH